MYRLWDTCLSGPYNVDVFSVGFDVESDEKHPLFFLNNPLVLSSFCPDDTEHTKLNRTIRTSCVKLLSWDIMNRRQLSGAFGYGAMASQITGASIVCPTICSGAHPRKHQSSAFVMGIYRWRVDSHHKGPVTQCSDVIFDQRLTKRLSKQSRRRWFQTSSCSAWRHCNVCFQQSCYRICAATYQ